MDAAALLARAGQRELVGGQEGQLVALALELRAEGGTLRSGS
ncbi:hypothetical protein ACL03H_18245 [Saccharopolyspora sp. MS10]